jgi:hypothetical protein
MSNQAKVVTRVLGEELEKFEADNICLRQTKVKKMGGQSGHRSEFTEWYDAPYVSTTVDGLDLTGNFNEITGLAVPHRVSTYTSVPFKLSNTDTLDTDELTRKVRSGMQAIDNRINRAVANIVVNQGAQYVGRTAALSGFADIAAVDALLCSQDVSATTEKTMILNPTDYNNMAADLAARQTVRKGDISTNAYERALISEIAAMKVFKTSFAPVKAAAAGGAITVTGAQSYTPQGSIIDAQGDPANVDNRSMNLTVSATANVVPGDKLTIAGVNAVSIQNKNDTGALRTFTVKSVVDGTTLEISPPIIDATAVGATTAAQAQRDYGNCTDVAAGGAAITFVNYDTAISNLFWENDSICINTAPVVGSEETLGGMILMNETTDLGLNVVIAKQGDINDLSTEWRMTTFFGVTNRDPMKNGILLGGQTP